MNNGVAEGQPLGGPAGDQQGGVGQQHQQVPHQAVGHTDTRHEYLQRVAGDGAGGQRELEILIFEEGGVGAENKCKEVGHGSNIIIEERKDAKQDVEQNKERADQADTNTH